MRWISFLGGDLGRHSVYSDLCGYDYIFEFDDKALGDAVCEFLRSN